MYKKDYLEQKHRYDEAKKRVKRVINDYFLVCFLVKYSYSGQI